MRTPAKPKKEKTVQISARVPASVNAKIKAEADRRFQGRLAMIAREILCSGAKDLPRV